MQQHAAALPAPLSHALQPPSVAGQHWSNLPSASSMAPSNGAPGHQFIQSGMLPASAITHAPAAMGSLYGGSMTLDGGSSAVLTELAQLHRSLDVRRDLAALAAEQQQQMRQLREDMMAELKQLRADVLGEVRRGRQATADVDARVAEAQESTQRSLWGLQSKLASSLSMHPSALPPHPYPSVSYAGYAPYPPAACQPLAPAIPSMHSTPSMLTPPGGLHASRQHA